MTWLKTANLNRYTFKPNIVYFEEGWHAIVFMRQYGYGFTVRGMLANNNWIQESSSSQTYYNDIEEAKAEALYALNDIKGRFVGAIVITEPKPRRRLSPEICRAMGIDENY